MNPKKIFTPNTVFRVARTYTGYLLGVVMDTFDGTTEDAIKVAQKISAEMNNTYPEASHIQSIIGILDKNGNFDRIISSNFKIVSDVNIELKKWDINETLRIIEKY